MSHFSLNIFIKVAESGETNCNLYCQVKNIVKFSTLKKMTNALL